MAEFVDALDQDSWAELGVDIEGDSMGAPASHPRALSSVWLYGFMTNVRSCRKLEEACRDQIPYLWLTGWQHPDHNTLWRFYKGHRQTMRKLFERTVRTAVSTKLVDLAVQAVDGTKVVVNASMKRIRGVGGRDDRTCVWRSRYPCMAAVRIALLTGGLSNRLPPAPSRRPLSRQEKHN